MFKDTIRPESVYTSAVRGGLQALVSLSFFFFRLTMHFFSHMYRKKQADKYLYSKHVFPTTDLTC